MVVLQARTREEIRVQIGHMLGAIKEIESDASGTTTTFLTDDVPIATADDFNGKWMVFTSDTDDGQIRQIINTTDSSNRITLTYFPATTGTNSSTATAEMWDQEYDPAAVHNAINQAIDDATGHIFDPVEDISLHTGAQFRFDIPTTFEVLYDIYFRTGTRSRLVKESGVVWDESIDTNITVALDTEDKIFGRQSTRFTVTSSVSNGDLASDNIGSADFSNFTHIEFPIKVRDATAADDLVLRLSATANGADTDKLISIPAITAETDTWVRVSMAGQSTNPFSPSLTTAIISIALEINANSGDNIIHLGEIRATRADGDQWSLFPRHLWEIDKEARDLIFLHVSDHAGFNHSVGSHDHYSSHDGLGRDYLLMKLKGGDNPARLTTDATATEVPESFVIYRAAGLLMSRPIRGESPDIARIRVNEANRLLGLAERAKATFPMLKNARFVT
jgi:hypothetical protein